MIGSGTEVDAAADAALVGAARRRIRREIGSHDRWSGLLTGGSFLVVMTAWIAAVPPRSVPVVTAAWCVAAFIVVGCVEFEIGPGCALPTTSVQVVMLFLLPPQLVPVAVVLGLAGSSLIARLWDPTRKERAMVLAGSGWQVVGPAVVFAHAHVRNATVADWPVYAVAIGAQFAFDAVISWIRNCYGFGVPVRQLARALEFTFLCDLSLAPLGFVAALAVPHSAGALIFLLPPTGLLAILQSDRRRQLDRTIALGAAFADTSDLARRDALTGVANRLAWEEAFARHVGNDDSAGVILADVDGLKRTNDTLGHAVGDRLLVEIAGLLVGEAASLTGAPVYRIGGDEFVIVLPLASPAATHAFAATVRQALEQAPDLDHGVPVSASVGMGYAATGELLGNAIAAADREVNTDKTRRGVRRH